MCRPDGDASLQAVIYEYQMIIVEVRIHFLHPSKSAGGGKNAAVERLLSASALAAHFIKTR
jgi:hypothetical protein